MRITYQDSFELTDITEASELTGYLSPLGGKLIKKLLESQEPLDLKAINRTVFEKEDSGYIHSEGQPKIGDDEDNKDGAEDIGNEETTCNDPSTLKIIFEDNNKENKSTKINKNSEEFAVKDPFKKSDSTKAKIICLSCGVIPCETEVYGDLLKKLAKDVAEKKANNNRAICQYCYKVFITSKYSRLGRGVRTRVPYCVESFVRSLYPDSCREYVGFVPSARVPGNRKPNDYEDNEVEREDCLYSTASEEELSEEE